MTRIISDQIIANCALGAGWKTPEDIATAVAIALAESNGDAEASHRNGDGSEDVGLWQINSSHGYDRTSILVPLNNAHAAFEVYTRQGWNAWTVYRTRAYLLFLPRAQRVAPTASAGGSGTAPVETKNVLVEGAERLTKTAGWVSNPHNWLRVAYVAGGAALVVGGVLVTAAGSKQAAAIRKALP